MKTFLIKLILFVLPFSLLAVSMDHFLSSSLSKSNSYADGEYPIWNCLYNGQVNSDIVIYGSSRALVHVDPFILADSLKSTVFNLGINGHSFRSQYFRHVLLLKFNKKPRIIIQTLDITSFEKSSDLYNPDQYLPYMLGNKEMEASTFTSFSSSDFKFPLIRYYGKKEAFLEICKLYLKPESNIPVRNRGYQPKDLTWNDDLMEAQRKLGMLEIKSDTALIKLFEVFLSECDSSNIKLILVFPPVYKEGQIFVSNWDEVIDIFKQYSNKYDVPLFDYSNDTLSFQKEYFYNSGHLNRNGAELFTRKLIKDIKELKFPE